jgi:hypothetical protein
MKLPLSIKKSITFNCAMLFAGLLHYRCVTFAKIFPMDLMLINLTFITRNFAFVYVLNEYSRHKSPINENIIIHQSYPNEFNINVLTSSSVDAVTYYYIKNSFASSFIDFDVCNLWYFIILMFYFEIIFDFFHYWLHRLLH